MTTTPTVTATSWVAWHRRSCRQPWQPAFTAASEVEALRWTLQASLGGDTYVGPAGIDPNAVRALGGRDKASTRRSRSEAAIVEELPVAVAPLTAAASGPAEAAIGQCKAAEAILDAAKGK